MSRHTTYRGVTVDMDSLRRENEKVPALGNMRVNARGDQLGKNGSVTKTSDQIARENHRIQSSVIQSGLKGPTTETLPSVADIPKVPVKSTVKKSKETELSNGDIVVGDDNES